MLGEDSKFHHDFGSDGPRSVAVTPRAANAERLALHQRSRAAGKSMPGCRATP
jgi:hypothetical protein